MVFLSQAFHGSYSVAAFFIFEYLAFFKLKIIFKLDTIVFELFKAIVRLTEVAQGRDQSQLEFK
jgi:hypothetical protein